MKLCYHCMSQISNDKASFCPECGKSLEPEQQKPRFLKAGTVLGRKFLAGYPLGAGGFGNTYIGWDQMLQRKVAIKEFYPEQYCGRGQDGLTVMVTDERLLPRFQRGLQQFLAEARSVAALHDVQGVVEISNFFEENGTGYIVMEYLEGMDVKTILKKSGDKKDYEWSRRVILTVLYTLKEIHKRGVLHRDIAPDNIFVTKEGIVKLIDFGAAKNVSAVENSTDVWLKAGYAPIEQYKNTFEQGPYTDLYAVAALFYRMLTGQKPIPAIQRLEDDALIPPSDMGIAIPQQAEMAIMVCLNMMPEYRLQSAEEFMEALDGKFFIPVYEPTWILPKEAPKGLKARIGALPMGAKVALCLLCIALVGGTGIGVMTAVDNKEQTGLSEDAQVVMVDLRGKTKEEAEQYVKELNRRAGWDITLNMDNTVFDASKESGTVCEQSIPAGTVLYDASTGSSDETNADTNTSADTEVSTDTEADANAGTTLAGLTYTKNGLNTEVTGTLSLTICDNTQVRYSELQGMNAFVIAKKLSIDTSDKTRFIEEEKGGANYYDLVSLDTGSENITEKMLADGKNQDKTFAYSDNLKIHYYATDFFYWQKLPDFTQFQTENKIPKQMVYRYSDENTKERTGKKSMKDSGMIDDSYFAVEGSHEVGDIVGQTVAADTEYDQSNPGDTDLKIQVVGTVLEYQKKTGKEFGNLLDEQGFGSCGFLYPNGKEASGSTSVQSVKVYDLGNDPNKENPLDYFKKDANDPENNSNLFFEIEVNYPATEAPAPAPTPAPSNDGGGGYSAPSSGGSSGGGSSHNAGKGFDF